LAAASAVSEATESLITLRRRSEPRFLPLESIGVEEPMFVVGRHGEDVGRLGDPNAGRGGAGAFRRHVHDHRNLRGQLGLVDRLHRGRKPAGRVEEDHGRVVVVVRRVRELARHVVLRDRVDLEVGPEGDREHARPEVAPAAPPTKTSEASTRAAPAS
jgi:hypothetical protein